MYFRSLLNEIGFPQDATVINEDNKSCIAMASDRITNQR
jgi:hypothetical protein